jgi:NAD(P)H-hydrate epimerase
MATGGSGDVLTGLIAALIAQGLEPFEAAQLGVYLHGKAGDLAAEEKGQVGLIATDIVDHLPMAFQQLL